MIDGMNHAEAWSAVAQAWDASADANEGPTSRATALLIERVAVHPGDRVLELAAGPGSLGARWSHLVGPEGGVVVSDIAPGMVDYARLRNREFDNVETAVIDAATIDAPDASFDVVACRMGLMFTPDPARALGEIYRVLRPGGRFGALTWGGIEHNPWMTCVGMAAMTSGIIAGAPPTGPGGIFSLADPDNLERLTTAAGFANVCVTAVDVTFAAETIDAHLERVTALAGPLAIALRTASPDQYAAFHRTATDLATPYLTTEGFAIPGRALLVTGRRPS